MATDLFIWKTDDKQVLFCTDLEVNRAFEGLSLLMNVITPKLYTNFMNYVDK